MESTATGADWDDDENWELCNDGDFVFKRRKRRRVDPDDDSSAQGPPSPSAADLQEDAEKFRRERKKKSLLKLKAKYQAEIDQWELLSSTLRAFEEKTRQLQLQQQQQQQQKQQRLEPQEREQTVSLVDELLLQADAHEAIIRDVSNLCDMAEATCNAEEEQLTQSLLNLPIWDSPKELMKSLCDP